MSTEQAAGQMAKDIATGVGVTFVGGGLVAFWVWMRKLAGLPKRVRNLEKTDAVVLRTLSALCKVQLSSNQHRRESDKSTEMIRAERLLRDADEAMDEHLRTVATGGRS